MKYKFALILLLGLSSILFSQEKGDYIWQFGRLDGGNNPFFAGCTMDFNFSPIDTFQEERDISFSHANASICDDDGNLLIYTNGRFVGDKTNLVMENGGNLNLDYTVAASDRMVLVQGALILPDPDGSSIYFVFHLGLDVLEFPTGIDLGSRPFFYSKVTFYNPFFPDGAVFEKNTEISADTFDVGKIVATRHANGRDWWIILSEWETNRYYRYMLSPDGVENLEIQEVGTPSYAGLGQAYFSPDGSKYAKLSLKKFEENYLDIYDFDRCTGLLSNHEQFFFTDNVGAGGVVISPSSQYLYLITTDEIRQFDLWADDIFDTETTVAEYDGFEELVILDNGDSLYIPTKFFLGQVAPDNKIYICSTNSVSSLTVINQPDLEGTACDIQQHSFYVPCLIDGTLPSFPNYRLGALEGSPCDTLNIIDATEEIFPNQKVEVFPNPSSGQVQLKMEQPLSENGQFILYDNLGKIVFEKELLKGSQSEAFNFQTLSKGMYFYEIRQRGVKIGAGKVVLID